MVLVRSRLKERMKPKEKDLMRSFWNFHLSPVMMPERLTEIFWKTVVLNIQRP